MLRKIDFKINQSIIIDDTKNKKSPQNWVKIVGENENFLYLFQFHKHTAVGEYNRLNAIG